MTFPRATARLQLHREFTLRDALQQVPYYARLGISHLYLSPITTARPGSTHGYDVIDPTTVSPELGGEEALRELVASLRQHEMGIVLDIVPNHMAAYHGNPWWWDVLKHGQHSSYATWFDIDWNPPEAVLEGRVLAPFLGESYGRVLESGQIRLDFDEVQGEYRVLVYEQPYPIAPGTLDTKGQTQEQLLAAHDPTAEEGRIRLHELLERQHYRLAWWRTAADRINWRRFFEINELIGVRVEEQSAFDAVHALPLRLYQEGLIDGLRIDHVDGLAQPLEYVKRLRSALRARRQDRPSGLSEAEPWLVVEKILAFDEVLDERWDVDGTTGYDFMDQVGAVLHDAEGGPELTALWTQFSGNSQTEQAMLEQVRIYMLQRHFAAERKALVGALGQLAALQPETRDWTLQAIARVLDRLLAVFPLYRTYITRHGCDAVDAQRLKSACDEARAGMEPGRQASDRELLQLLQDWLCCKKVDSKAADIHWEVIRRFQQLTPPLAAKSLEDTTFYRYGRLLSRNEVGSDPSVVALALPDFHQRNAWRARHKPLSMLATATHDHKRGEDVRARLAVLSEISHEWAATCRQWMQWAGSDPLHDARTAERLMLFQTLVGAWPMDLSSRDRAGLAVFARRVAQWQTKALREAKLHSSWVEPNLRYERESAEFLCRVLGLPTNVLDESQSEDESSVEEKTPASNGTNLSSRPVAAPRGLALQIEEFVNQIAPAGALNGLVQTLLRITCPGVPDLYQGTELWDFSLVDPDNRRPVDYSLRNNALDQARNGLDIAALLKDWRSGRVKQALIFQVLQLRREWPDLFAEGAYVKLPVVGPRTEQIIAFMRSHGDRQVLVVVPRLCAPVVKADGLGFPTGYWGDTAVVVPRHSRVGVQDLFDGVIRTPRYDGSVLVAELFGERPFALLVSTAD